MVFPASHGITHGRCMGEANSICPEGPVLNHWCTKIDDERLHTLVCEVESTLDSRPLTALSDSPSDLEASTPNHILRVESGNTLPLGGLSPGDALRRRWQHAQLLADRFWVRWRSGYLHTLRMRHRKISPSRNFHSRDLVLLVDPLLPRNRWRMGRVSKVIPSDDGLVRKVQVRTSLGLPLWPIVKLSS
ncbi:uncharacterized protein LOC122266878 [Penaeus japonicus]|uniref:uncharacterized protein LOC122266878 n=1 Tax=Penaeus japonicus TaxID=27405 RepID=UPI001C711401|nr:uncharacterized protein LOC122266878 [Penaeus japonicus]